MLAMGLNDANAYRWGGDEFMLICGIAENPAIVDLCQEITDLMSIPVIIDEMKV